MGLFLIILNEHVCFKQMGVKHIAKGFYFILFFTFFIIYIIMLLVNYILVTKTERFSSSFIFAGGRGQDYLQPGSLTAILHKLLDEQEKDAHSSPSTS